MKDHGILSYPYDTAHLPAEGFAIEIDANAEARAELAAAYDLVAVSGLSAAATVMPSGRGMVTVEGRVVADIVQACVVSLEPVPQHIDEGFSVRFVPAGTPEAQPPAGLAREVAIDPDAPDPPEPMQGTGVDLGALVEEMFVLAIDPYPRAPGAALPAGGIDEADSEEESPFAVLRGLVRSGK